MRWRSVRSGLTASPPLNRDDTFPAHHCSLGPWTPNHPSHAPPRKSKAPKAAA